MICASADAPPPVTVHVPKLFGFPDSASAYDPVTVPFEPVIVNVLSKSKIAERYCPGEFGTGMLRGPSTTVPVSVMVPGYAPDCTSAVAENEIVLSDASSQLKLVIVWGGSAEMNVGETDAGTESARAAG